MIIAYGFGYLIGGSGRTDYNIDLALHETIEYGLINGPIAGIIAFGVAHKFDRADESIDQSSRFLKMGLVIAILSTVAGTIFWSLFHWIYTFGNLLAISFTLYTFTIFYIGAGIIFVVGPLFGLLAGKLASRMN